MTLMEYVNVEYGGNQERCSEEIKVKECAEFRRTLYHGSVRDLQEVMCGIDTLSKGDRYRSLVDVEGVSRFTVVELRVDPDDLRDLPIWNKGKVIYVI